MKHMSGGCTSGDEQTRLQAFQASQVSSTSVFKRWNRQFWQFRLVSQRCGREIVSHRAILRQREDRTESAIWASISAQSLSGRAWLDGPPPLAGMAPPFSSLMTRSLSPLGADMSSFSGFCDPSGMAANCACSGKDETSTELCLLGLIRDV